LGFSSYIQIRDFYFPLSGGVVWYNLAVAAVLWGVLFYYLCIKFNFILLSLQALISLEPDPQRAIRRALALAVTRKELMIVSTQTGIE